MVTAIKHSKIKSKQAFPAAPPLQNGDRLTRFEFERRYSAMPNLKKAELIEGVVYMPSPVSYVQHSRPHARVNAWLSLYMLVTPGVEVGDNASLRLDTDNEPQPDAFLIVDPELGGQAKISADGYIEGAPELVVEISASTASIDLHDKLNAYRRNGVLEYIVWRVRDQAIDWFMLADGLYERQIVDKSGLFRSRAFPGLVLDPGALVAGHLDRVAQVQNDAVKSKAHANFAKKLAAAKGKSR